MNTDKLNLKIKKILGNGAKKVIAKMLFPFRNSFILFNVSNKAKSDKVNLNYWSESDNLGDLLAPVIVDHMLEQKGISPDKKVSGRKHLYAVGSILTAGLQDATVWGSGVLNPVISYRLEKRKFDVRSVRGPLTRIVLTDYGYKVPEIFGDPAMLMPEIYQPADTEKKYRYGLILHKDYRSENDLSGEESLKIDICTSDYKDFINKIVSCDMIISSSLHGIILAEAYGVRAVLLKPQVDLFKYYDYYYSTGRLDFPVADSVEEAKKTKAADIPDFTAIRQNIKSAFPYDIYR